MTNTEQLAENYRQPFRGPGNHISSMDIKEAYKEGAADMLGRVLKYLECEHPTFFDNFGEEIKFAMEE